MKNLNDVTPKCPLCGNPISKIREFDSENDGDTYVSTVTGRCDSCNRKFIWTDYYKYSNSGKMFEVKD